MKYVVTLRLPPPRSGPTAALGAVRAVVALSLLGPPGPPGSGYVFTQTTPVAFWSWPNPMGRLVSTTLYDLTGAEIEADVTCTEALVTVTFAQPQSGKLVLT